MIYHVIYKLKYKDNYKLTKLSEDTLNVIILKLDKSELNLKFIKNYIKLSYNQKIYFSDISEIDIIKINKFKNN